MIDLKAFMDQTVDQPLDIGERCPLCGTLFPKEGKRALCSHIRWSHKAKRFLIREAPKPEHVQAQKYARVPAWRIQRRGKRGQKI